MAKEYNYYEMSHYEATKLSLPQRICWWLTHEKTRQAREKGLIGLDEYIECVPRCEKELAEREEYARTINDRYIREPKVV